MIWPGLVSRFGSHVFDEIHTEEGWISSGNATSFGQDTDVLMLTTNLLKKVRSQIYLLDIHLLLDCH